eukprot:615727-Pyramimonas_sp.AAC.1
MAKWSSFAAARACSHAIGPPVASTLQLCPMTIRVGLPPYRTGRNTPPHSATLSSRSLNGSTRLTMLPHMMARDGDA